MYAINTSVPQSSPYQTYDVCLQVGHSFQVLGEVFRVSRCLLVTIPWLANGDVRMSCDGPRCTQLRTTYIVGTTFISRSRSTRVDRGKPSICCRTDSFSNYLLSCIYRRGIPPRKTTLTKFKKEIWLYFQGDKFTCGPSMSALLTVDAKKQVYL